MCAVQLDVICTVQKLNGGLVGDQVDDLAPHNLVPTLDRHVQEKYVDCHGDEGAEEVAGGDAAIQSRIGKNHEPKSLLRRPNQLNRHPESHQARIVRVHSMQSQDGEEEEKACESCQNCQITTAFLKGVPDGLTVFSQLVLGRDCQESEEIQTHNCKEEAPETHVYNDPDFGPGPRSDAAADGRAVKSSHGHDQALLSLQVLVWRWTWFRRLLIHQAIKGLLPCDLPIILQPLKPALCHSLRNFLPSNGPKSPDKCRKIICICVCKRVCVNGLSLKCRVTLAIKPYIYEREREREREWERK